MAVTALTRSDVYEPALHLPILFLGGFAFELTMKAAILADGANEDLLKSLRHNLDACYRETLQRGYIPTDADQLESVLVLLSQGHEDMAYRYLPDVEVIDAPNLGRLGQTLLAHVSAIEEQFDVWKISGALPE